MLNKLFLGPFYGHYKVENHRELSSIISKKIENVEDYNGWNQNCNVQVKMVDDLNFIVPYVKPLLRQFSEELESKINFEFVGGGWVSCYNKGGFQEVHQHSHSDVSVVYFMNSEKDFAKFYFLDRHSNDFSDSWIRKVFPTQLTDTFFPNIEEGDLLIFPSHIFHGVSIHKSNVLRKTFAFNMDIHSLRD